MDSVDGSTPRSPQTAFFSVFGTVRSDALCNSFLLLVVRPGTPNRFLLLVVKMLLVAMPGAPSSDALCS